MASLNWLNDLACHMGEWRVVSGVRFAILLYYSMNPSMDLSHRRRRLFMAAIALLAAITAFILWMGDDPSNFDNGEDTSEFFQRMLSETRLRMNKNPAIINNRLNLISEDSCNGVLITSQGGVGSSEFIMALERVEMKGASFYTNDERDLDGLKHLPATEWEHTADEMHHYTPKWKEGEDCYSKALVIIGDPVHTIESTYRRFRLKHINKLKFRSSRSSFPETANLSGIYNGIAKHGIDTTGITNYVSSWYEASQDPEHWPDIRLVTAKTLFNNAVDHARWIGVDEDSLGEFQGLHFDARKQRKNEPSVYEERVKEKVTGVFKKVQDIVDLVENGPPATVSES
mmetsp:Transcript_37303/g.63494  ORF Transcript_37303/g.63494 Transcript_37303/m.63494 type:complete len:343 (+) Transcript_37303:1-1029(+)